MVSRGRAEDQPRSSQSPPHLRSNDLWKVIEMPVSGMQGKVVLQHESREPHIVCRNRRALLPELTKDGCIVVSRLVVGEEHADAIFQKKPPKRSLVLDLPAPVRKAGSKLADHHKRQQDDLGFLEQADRLLDASAEIDIAVRIERNPHRQRALSTRS